MRQSFATLAVVIALVVVVLVAGGALFTVQQTEQALVLRFGEPVAGRGLVTTPGLHYKLPLIETVVTLDNRLLDLESPQQEVIASDNQRLVVDAFLRYRITDPLKFYQTVGTTDGARNQLGSVLNSALRRVLGGATITDIVRDKRDELMSAILKTVNQEGDRIGVNVLDTRIRRADFPREISDGVFRRMVSERQREAAEFRAQGAEISQRIKAKADRDVTVLTAEAQQKADVTRGEGDAERNRIFAEAYGRDPDFFAFYRSMQAYETSLKPGDTRLVVSPTSDFFRYFSDPAGGVAGGQTPTPKTGAPGEPQARN